MAFPIALAVGAGLALYGAYQKSQAEKKAKANLANRPTYEPIPEDQSELNLAQAQGNIGMGAGARTVLQNNADRLLSTSTNAALMAGADANTIAGITERAQNAYNQNAIYDDQVRQGHLANLMRTYSMYNAQRRGDADKQFQVNQYGPWADRQQLFSSQIAGGQQTMNSGLGLVGQSLSGMSFGGHKGGSGNSMGAEAIGSNDRSLMASGMGSAGSTGYYSDNFGQGRQMDIPNYGSVGSPAVNPFLTPYYVNQ